MTASATGPLNLNGSGGWTPPDTSQQRLQLDNLLRRELKVADPSDAGQVAQALLTRYQGSTRARAIEQEARGLPYLPVAPAPVHFSGNGQSSSAAELQQGLDDVERDLQELTTNAALKDVIPELQGWAQALRNAAREGANAARFGLDARQRDKALAIRRQLGDYARMARIVGALTPTMGMAYRKLAQSCDEVASIILVMIGEALANGGFKGGQFLFQVPYGELQVRRDAAIYALRNLVGATQDAYGPEDWPRGLNAYRQLFQVLDSQGQADLRVLLVEGELARIMDELIQRAAQGTAAGLRAVGATSRIELARFRRLAVIGQDAVSPESPPLAGFLEALVLFADAFAGSGGGRLLSIARPAILHYGLYQNDAAPATARLLDLVEARGRLANQVDCRFACACDGDEIEVLIALDMVLSQLDRAIDLYVLGSEDFGEPERRAGSYWLVIDEVKKLLVGGKRYGKIKQTLKDAKEQLIPEGNAIPSLDDAMRLYLVSINGASTGSPINLAVTPDPAPIFPEQSIFSLLEAYDATEVRQKTLPVGTVPRIPQIEEVFGIMHDELCMQMQIEAEWGPLIRSLAAGCRDPGAAMAKARKALHDALSRLGDPNCVGYRGSIPASLHTLAEARTFGRRLSGGS